MMIRELVRLALGLLILGFHKQIADFIIVQEERLAQMLRARGFDVPTFPTAESARTVYFVFGVMVSCFALIRIYTQL